MTDETTIIDFLRVQFAKVNQRFDVSATLAERGRRLTRLDLRLAALLRDQAGDAENAAHQSIRIDDLVERVVRIERRLVLVDTQ